MNTHYGQAMQANDMLKFVEGASRALLVLHKLKNQDINKVHRYPVLVYRGMSGVAAATALALYMHMHHPDFRTAQMYVRKEGEQAHGAQVEFADHLRRYPAGDWQAEIVEEYYPVFIDDCIDSGNTFCKTGIALKDAGILWAEEDWSALLEMAVVMRLRFGKALNPKAYLSWADFSHRCRYNSSESSPPLEEDMLSSYTALQEEYAKTAVRAGE